MAIYNIYCDESCHLERDDSNAMVLGAIWCPKDKVRSVHKEIKAIRLRHELSPHTEIKWNKVSPSKVGFYLDLVDYFFGAPDLHFRALVIPNKRVLNHQAFSSDHNTWYYKMVFNLLKVIFDSSNRFHIYLDQKDTQSAERIRKLHEVLAHNIYDFDRNIVERVESVQSKEVGILQLGDLLMGAVGKANRNLSQRSDAKNSIIERIRRRSGKSLTKSTLQREDKVNIFIWQGSGADEQ